MRPIVGLIHFHSVLGSSNPFHRQRCVASRRFGGQSLMEWMVGRVSETEQLDQVAVLLPQQLAADDPVFWGRIPPHVRLIEVRGERPLVDLLHAQEVTEAGAMVLVSIAQPFVDPGLIDQLVLVAERQGADYAAFRSGLSAEWCSARAIRDIQWIDRAQNSKGAGRQQPAGAGRQQPARGHATESGVATTANRETRRIDAASDLPWQQAIAWMADRPDTYRVQQLGLPGSSDQSELRLTIHNAEDWEHAHLIYEALGPERVDRHQVLRLLDQNPELRQRMARLNHAELNTSAP